MSSGIGTPSPLINNTRDADLHTGKAVTKFSIPSYIRVDDSTNWWRVRETLRIPASGPCGLGEKRPSLNVLCGPASSSPACRRTLASQKLAFAAGAQQRFSKDRRNGRPAATRSILGIDTLRLTR